MATCNVKTTANASYSTATGYSTTYWRMFLYLTRPEPCAFRLHLSLLPTVHSTILARGRYCVIVRMHEMGEWQGMQQTGSTLYTCLSVLEYLACFHTRESNLLNHLEKESTRCWTASRSVRVIVPLCAIRTNRFLRSAPTVTRYVRTEIPTTKSIIDKR